MAGGTTMTNTVINSCPDDFTSHTIPVTVETFNCHGIKQSCFYVAERLKLCDILCLQETWLRPHELQFVHKLGGNSLTDCDIFFKSSMNDIDACYSGRPFGGLVTIVRYNEHFKGTEIYVDSDRLQVVALKDKSSNTVHVIINVYMPYFHSGDKTQTEEYIQTLDLLQNIIDTYSGICPVKVIGDLNTQLPTSVQLNKRWYRDNGFNIHSAILYDFLVANDMYAADVESNQNVKHTFFCYSRNVFTWIDHILCLDRDKESVVSCKIIEHCDNNVSDHLPVQLKCNIKVSKSNSSVKVNNPSINVVHVPPDWSSHSRNNKYCSILESYLCKMTPIANTTQSRDKIVDLLDLRLEEVTQAIHSAARESGCIPVKNLKPKPFWCPSLSILRDKKRFWWRIWVASDRPRTGIIFSIYKDLKKRFRKVCRQNVNNCVLKEVDTLNHLYKKHNMKGFWNKLKCLQRSRVNSKLGPDDFASYFSKIMSDNPKDLNSKQREVCDTVERKVNFLSSIKTPPKVLISPFDIKSKIQALNKGVSPGCDGVTAEHLRYGISDVLCKTLSELLTIMFTHSIVPTVFTTGILVPLIKKPTLCSDKVESYRPVTLSSVFCKIAELFLTPRFNVHNTQFGFQSGKGTSFVTCFINDSTSYFNQNGSPVYLSSLDAEKCFDSIWHMGLLYKLNGILSDNLWLFIYKWYTSSNAVVRWKSSVSNKFKITKGMRQGSVLSPALFNIYLNDLMVNLMNVNAGIRVFNQKINSCAYADDVNLMASTCTGLQCLINECVEYSKMWRFRFGIKKTNIITIGKNLLEVMPSVTLDGDVISNVDQLEILGVTVNTKCSYSSHVENRTRSCRKSMYKLSCCGMTYPGLNTEVKRYLWNSVGAPTLLYGTECIPLSASDMHSLKSTQSNIIKNVLGLSKRNHHSKLLLALNIPKIDDVISKNTLGFYNRIFNVDSPLLCMQKNLLEHYIISGCSYKNTVIDKVISMGFSPMAIAIDPVFKCKIKLSYNFNEDAGLIDSLKYLLYQDNYIKRDSDEFTLVNLMTKSF